MNASERARLALRFSTGFDAKPTPTDADLAAHLYDVTFTYAPNGISLSFPVLALDEPNALEIALLRMELDLRSVSGSTVVARQRTLETSGEAMGHALCLEYADEHACRQEAWAARHEPEPAEKINTLGGIKF